MYLELALLDKNCKEEDSVQGIFAAAEYNFDGISVLPNFVHVVKQYSNDILLSCPIDFPSGTSATTTRNHAVLTAIRAGVDAIDLVVGQFSGNLSKLISDIESNFAICRDKNVELRVMMEYRSYEDYNRFFETVCLISEMGIEYIIPSTGDRVDSYIDNIVASKLIMDRTGAKTISNGNVLNKEQYEKVRQSGVYGVRFHSINVVKNIFGV